MLVALIVTLLMADHELRGPAEYVVKMGDHSANELPLTVINYSNSELEIWAAGFWPNHSLDMRTTDGAAVPLTELGRAGKRRFESAERNKNFPITIGPGKTYRYKTPSLSASFELKPGRYVLVVTYSEKHFGTPLRMQTKPLSIRVVD